MARGPIPAASGHSPAAQALSAAGRPLAWPGRPGRTAPILLAACAAGAVLQGAPAAAASPAGQETSVGGVTVTAPACRDPQDPAPACAAQRLDQAAKAAAARTPDEAEPASSAPDARSPAAAIGLGTPAAAAQQPGTPFGKPPGYQPPPLPGGWSGAGPLARTPR